jgi:predicted nucleic acid-binding protein
MTEPFIDTDVIIRLLTGDDPVKQDRAKALFRGVEDGSLTLQAPLTVIADAVHVLSSISTSAIR